MSGAKRVRPRNGNLDIVCTDENMIRIFEMTTGLDRIFGIFPSAERPSRRPHPDRLGRTTTPRGERRRVTQGARRGDGDGALQREGSAAQQLPQCGRRNVEDKDIRGRAHLHRGWLRDPSVGVQPVQGVRAAWGLDFRRGGRKSSRRDEFACRCAFEPCGREFMTTNSAKKYCTDSCRMKAFQARVMAARRMGDMRGARHAS